MNQSTKQRIVGTIVLLSAAVILLPVIFDGDGSYQAPLESRIPAPPPFQEPARVIQERPVIAANSNAVTDESPQAEADESATATQTSTPPSSDDTTSGATDSINSDTETPATATASAVSESPQLDSQGLPEGWSVRMGAFSVANNATALVKTLQDRNLRAYSRSIIVNNSPMQVVYVGPLIDRVAAQQLLDQMNRDYSELPGKRIERFEIESL